MSRVHKRFNREPARTDSPRRTAIRTAFLLFHLCLVPSPQCLLVLTSIPDRGPVLGLLASGRENAKEAVRAFGVVGLVKEGDVNEPLA
ncbi:MAG: hypothetical protein GIKADHBN_02093 [Phycisphaerales bacterium]|nr:hypothetical protein [Phycisphaerales bacterium]